MNEIITWAAQHNTIIIQVAFSIVLLLILIYVYRLFFVSSSSGSVESTIELNEVNQKLDRLLEQKTSGIQVIEKVVASVPEAVDAAGVAPLSAEAAAAAGSELEQLKTENAKLKVQLNESEKKIFELAPVVGAETSLKEESQVDPAQITELNKQIDELKSRLSEYDIIADDIAELSQLRTENADLKKRLETEGGATPEPAEVPAESTAAEGVEEASLSPSVPEPQPTAPNDSQSAASAQSQPAAPNEPQPAAPNEPQPAAEEIIMEPLPESKVAESGGVPGFDAETSALLDSLVAETDAAASSQVQAQPETAETAPEATVSEPVEASSSQPEESVQSQSAAEEQPKVVMDQNIPEAEKNLINEFEKSIQKGS